ncbi:MULTISPECIES: GrpB family protein [unclassified Lactococcus]|uniref:GrpB family protein n=1 Tax=unclassified Lactococcus TaxID=2643510 RepID=UPI0011CC787F|nr:MULTISPECIES: GrpB family protein [unclassified Lactococcus]MQW22381.1 GrpB family protein [Lactococcus sp. dk101]TXK45416.1 GrpB family protein [Lactococcus sp. dk310]TXK51749.1 GrpB family protein [Lactococcus sp. dk322]
MLGVERNHVNLVEHDRDWYFEFLRTEKILKKILGQKILQIEHVGSTSIQGIVAKPIIDIAVVVRSLDNSDVVKLEKAGYENCGDPMNIGKMLFVKREHGTISTHHIGIYLPDNENFMGSIMFRDFLNAHEQERKTYEELKKELLYRYPDNRSSYTRAIPPIRVLKVSLLKKLF